MGASITFNVDKLIKKLDIIQKSHLPKAAEQALKSFGFDARELLQKEMQDKYGAVTPFTLRSPYFKLQSGMGRYELLLGISDKANGVAPNRYLAPTDRSQGAGRKPVQPTSLAGALRARYGIDDIPVPVRSSRAGAQFIDKRGNLKSRKVQRLLDQLQNPGQGREDYFLVKPGQSSHLSGGIYRRYRVKSANLSNVFTFKSQVSQQPTLDFEGVLLEAARKELPVLIQKKLDRLLR